MRLLDQWLHYVDTEEKLPLFQKSCKSYDIAKLSHINWNDPGISQVVVEVAREKNLSKLRTASLDEIQQTLEILDSCNEKIHVRTVYSELLSLEASKSLFVLVSNTRLERAISY
jgi:hypothetical protein